MKEIFRICASPRRTDGRLMWPLWPPNYVYRMLCSPCLSAAD